MKISKIVAKNIKHIRTAKSITQGELALKIGLEKIHIEKIENGKRVVSLEVLEKISEIFDVKPFDFLKDDFKKND